MPDPPTPQPPAEDLAPATPAPPVPAPTVTTSRNLRQPAPAPAPAKPAAPSTANEKQFGRKTPAVRVEYLGPDQPKVIVGAMPWQGNVATRKVREFWAAEAAEPFQNVTFAELGLAPKGSLDGKRPAFQVTKL